MNMGAHPVSTQSFLPTIAANGVRRGALRGRISLRERAPRWMAALHALGVIGSIGGGCAPAQRSGPENSARGAIVRIVNLSDCEWKITIRPTREGRSRTTRVPPHATPKVVVPAGDYQLEQSAVDLALVTPGPRRLSTPLAAGGHYEWQLATLQSPAPGDAELDPAPSSR